MNKYEGMFMIDSRAAKRDWDLQVNHVKEILEKHKAKLVMQNRWDERKLAYEIDGQKRAAYLLAYFEAEGDSIGKINREVQLSDTIMRSLILRTSQFPDKEVDARSDKPLFEDGDSDSDGAARKAGRRKDREEADEDGADGAEEAAEEESSSPKQEQAPEEEEKKEAKAAQEAPEPEPPAQEEEAPPEGEAPEAKEQE